MTSSILVWFALLGWLNVLQTQTPPPKPAQLHYAVIYSDMDGTLLDGSAGVRPATHKALESFRACGGKLGLASGRTLEQVKAYLPALKPNLPLVLSNGATVYSPDGTKLLWASYVNPQIVRQALKAGALLPGVQGAVVQELERDLVDRDSSKLAEFLKKANMANFSVDKGMVSGYEGQALKVMFIVKDRKAGDRLKLALLEPLKGKASVMVTSGRTVEVVSETTDKSFAILKVLEQEGLLVDDAVVFGDGENDARMVASVGLGVAMGNCRPATCEAADVLIGPASTDALAKFIRSLVLTPSCDR